MLSFRHRTVFKLARGIGISLSLDGRIVRGGEKEVASEMALDPEQSAPRDRQLETSLHQPTKSEQEVYRLQATLVTGGNDDSNAGVRPENLVWIFGSGRSGSTWLGTMMGDAEGYELWDEPLVGRLFGEFRDKETATNLRRADFILGDSIREAWIAGIRSLILSVARARFPEVDEQSYLVVKEPNGSLGAPLLMEALPESRMVFLVRDPRDVVASALDGQRKGGHGYERAIKGGRKNRLIDNPANSSPDAVVERRSHVYLRNVNGSKQAYDAHQGHKVLVRYEDLRAYAFSTMKHVYAALGLPANEEELARAVEKHAWENIPEEEKGQGKFYRKARPGSWREDLSPKQAKVVERITAPLLEEFYSG